MKILKKLQLKISNINVPYSLEDIWLSDTIPSRKKFNGRVLRIKEYPSEGEVVHLFNARGYKVFYKTVKARRRNQLTSDPADWDNCKEYSFEFDHLIKLSQKETA